MEPEIGNERRGRMRSGPPVATGGQSLAGVPGNDSPHPLGRATAESPASVDRWSGGEYRKPNEAWLALKHSPGLPGSRGLRPASDGCLGPLIS